MSVEELDSPPSMRPLYAKALAGALPLIGGGGDELPDRELALPQIEIDVHHLREYAEVCGFRLADELPPTYLHMFAFPLQMQLMTDRAFPFPVLGLVHIANRIEQLRPVRTEETLSLRVRAEHLREHPKGRQVDLVAEASSGGETVWHSTSTYLRRGGGGGAAEDGAEDPAERGSTRERHAALWTVPADIGRRYAGVSGDVNPIHMSSVSAKLFGFPKAIAHGMWTKARCLAAFEGKLPDHAVIDVRFKKPILLPAKVAFRSNHEGEGWALDLRDPKKGAHHLTGVIQPG